jgi:cell division septation protein DedD
MTSASATRPVLITLALVLSGCGAVDGDSPSFRALADRVAAIDIPLDPEAAGSAQVEPRPAAEKPGLRPLKFSPVHVQVMSPHEMWDARDALSGGTALLAADDADSDGLRDAVVRMARPRLEPVAQTAAPDAGRAELEPRAASTETPKLRPAVVRPAPQSEGRMIQLGAFSSPAGAQAAWARLKARADLSNFSPVFERVEIDGRSLTRLKVGPIPAEAASTLCAAAQVADPWCRRAG